MLVAAEVALAVGLLAGSTLLMRSYMRVMDTRLGFDPVDATAAAVSLPALLYGDDSPQVAAFHARVLSTLQETPGVASVGFSNIAPLGGNNISGSLEVEGKPQDPRGPFNSYALYRVVGGEFFRAAGIPLIRGRTFEEGDVLGAPRVVVVNEAFANAEWAGQDPVGQRVRPYGMDLQDEEWATVIGVVGDVRSSSPIDRVMPTYYFDHRQRPPFRTRAVTYVVRSPLPPTSVSAVVRDAVRAADANVPVEFRTLQDVVSGAVSDRRFTMLVLVGFATAALVLAVIGIFAVVSYSVAQRTREIGVRIALGSTPGRVRGLVIGDAMFAVAPGLLVGGAITLASAGALRSLLYDVSPLDPIGVATAMATLALAAAASSLGPAVRATRIDPMNAIRGE